LAVVFGFHREVGRNAGAVGPRVASIGIRQGSIIGFVSLDTTSGNDGNTATVTNLGQASAGVDGSNNTGNSATVPTTALPRRASPAPAMTAIRPP
jgi:hypothetical protein